MNEPLGREREVRQLGATTVDGAPVAYVIALAAVVTVLAFIPLSVVLGGKAFPMSQSVYPLVGWILGPLAGALASGVGALVGTFVAPHTATIPLVTIAGAVAGSAAAGVMIAGEKRRWWWQPLGVLFTLIFALYVGWAVFRNGAGVGTVLLGSFIDWSALLLFLLPTRALVAQWIGDVDLKQVTLGMLLGTWTAAGLSHLTGSLIMYLITNWPNVVWMGMAPLSPLEHAARMGVGTVIGVGVVAGLRATGLVKPRWAGY